MELLLDLTFTVEQKQSDGPPQDQETFEANAGTVTAVAVAVGPHLVAGFLLQPGRTNDDRFLDIQ